MELSPETSASPDRLAFLQPLAKAPDKSRQRMIKNDGCSEKLLDDIQGTFSSTPECKI